MGSNPTGVIDVSCECCVLSGRGPSILYLLYTSDLPQPEEAIVATFADDIAVMTVGDSFEEATEKLRAVDQVNNWTRKCLINLKWSQVGTCGLNQQKISTYSDNYEWQSCPSLKHNKVPWHVAGCQAALEGTCQEKTRRAWTKIQGNVQDYFANKCTFYQNVKCYSLYLKYLFIWLLHVSVTLDHHQGQYDGTLLK